MAAHPPTVEEMYNNFKGRRKGIIKLLTEDFVDFSVQCNPDNGPLYLYAFPDGRWEVASLSTLSEMLEPAIGIVFPRDTRSQDEWVLVAAYRCDPWLFHVSHIFGALFDKNQKKQLFDMINELPTVPDEVAKFWKIEPSRVEAIATKYWKEMLARTSTSEFLSVNN